MIAAAIRSIARSYSPRVQRTGSFKALSDACNMCECGPPSAYQLAVASVCGSDVLQCTHAVSCSTVGGACKLLDPQCRRRLHNMLHTDAGMRLSPGWLSFHDTPCRGNRQVMAVRPT